MNPPFVVHHARSWGSPFVLGAMMPLQAAAFPHSRAGKSLRIRYAATVDLLRAAPLPLVAQVWGPMTMAATQMGLEAYLESLAGSADSYSPTADGLEASILASQHALEARALVLWIAEPIAALVDPDVLVSVWLPPMRRLLALARASGADPVVHVSGAAGHVLEPAARLGVSGISITADTPLALAREVLPDHVVVFGNLDSMRLGDRSEEWLRQQGASMAAEMRGWPFVATPGSAIPDHAPVESIEAFVAGVRGQDTRP